MSSQVAPSRFEFRKRHYGFGNAPNATEVETHLETARLEARILLAKHLLVCSHLHAARIDNHTPVAAAEGNADQFGLIALNNRVCLSRARFAFTLFQSRRRGRHDLTTLHDRQLASLLVKYDIVCTVLNKRSIDLGIRQKRHLNSLALGKGSCACQSNKQESNHNSINY